MDYTVYAGTLSGTPVDLARSALYDTYSNYLFFRSSEHHYTLIVGNIDFDTYQYTDCAVYQIYYHVTSDISTDRYYQYYKVSDSDNGYVHNPNNYQMYASTGYYPKLIDRGDIIVQATTLFVIVIFFSFLLFESMFNRVSRR